MQFLFLNLASNDPEDRNSTYCWFLYDININQSPCLMESPSSQLNPYTPPNDYQTFNAPYKPPPPTNQTLIGAHSFGLPHI